VLPSLALASLPTPYISKEIDLLVGVVHINIRSKSAVEQSGARSRHKISKLSG